MTSGVDTPHGEEALRKALADFCNAFTNRGETTSLKQWNDRMKSAYDNAVLALGGQTHPSETKAIQHPQSHDEATKRIGECVREIEMIADTFGYDPYEWLQPREEL